MGAPTPLPLPFDTRSHCGHGGHLWCEWITSSRIWQRIRPVVNPARDCSELASLAELSRFYAVLTLPTTSRPPCCWREGGICIISGSWILMSISPLPLHVGCSTCQHRTRLGSLATRGWWRLLVPWNRHNSGLILTLHSLLIKCKPDT